MGDNARNKFVKASKVIKSYISGKQNEVFKFPLEFLYFILFYFVLFCFVLFCFIIFWSIHICRAMLR